MEILFHLNEEREEISPSPPLSSRTIFPQRSMNFLILLSRPPTFRGEEKTEEQ